MSVPASRMAPRNPGTMGDPNKIMGLPKPVFWIVVVVGLILAYMIFKNSGSSNQAATSANTSGDGDWAADDALAAAAEQGMASAGLPNLPGTNGNPNNTNMSTPDNSAITTPTSTSTPAPASPPISPYAPYYPAAPTSSYGSGGAYSTGPGTPTAGGAITGRGIQGGL